MRKSVQQFGKGTRKKEGDRRCGIGTGEEKRGRKKGKGKGGEGNGTKKGETGKIKGGIGKWQEEN
jgi:hypothetical protein